MIILFNKIESPKAFSMKFEYNTAYPVIAFNMKVDLETGEIEYEFFVKNDNRLLKITSDDESLYSFILLGGS